MAKGKRPDELLPTRASLIARLKDLDDHHSWQEFFDLYSGFIHHIAMKSGLTDTEAKEVVQETFIAVAKYIGDFQYDPAGSFKAWLLQGTRWRIADQFKRRLPVSPSAAPDPEGDGRRTTEMERIPNPTSHGPDAKWEQDWREHVEETALERLRRELNPKHYQIFDSYVLKRWPIKDVTETFGVKPDLVYKVKERVMEALQVEVLRLEKAGV